MVTKGEKRGEKNYLLMILLAVVAILVVIWIIFSVRSTYQVQEAEKGIEDLEAMTKAELEAEYLRQDTRQLMIENNQLVSPWQQISSYATVFTVIVALLGVFTTIWKQFSEQRQDREQREAESIRRLDEKFSSIVRDLGSDNASLKVSAVVSLMTFLRNEYAQFHEQVYLILLANLKIKHDLQVNRLLIKAFEEAIRLKLTRIYASGGEEVLDLTHTLLYRIDLAGLDLSSADIAFADLQLANFRGATLTRVKGYQANLSKAKFTNAILEEARLNEANLEGAHFHETNLVSATLKKTNLKGAQFYEAKLQSAHFEEADLSGACFEQANLKDTYFYGVKLTKDTLISIKKAYHWQDAHFDEEVNAKLAVLSAG